MSVFVTVETSVSVATCVSKAVRTVVVVKISVCVFASYLRDRKQISCCRTDGFRGRGKGRLGGRFYVCRGKQSCICE